MKEACGGENKEGGSHSRSLEIFVEISKVIYGSTLIRMPCRFRFRFCCVDCSNLESLKSFDGESDDVRCFCHNFKEFGGVLEGKQKRRRRGGVCKGLKSRVAVVEGIRRKRRCC